MKLARPIAEDGGRELLAQALARQRKGRAVVVDLPAPVVPVDRLLWAPLALDSRVLWDPGEGQQSFAGLGVGVRLRARGRRRYRLIRDAAQAALESFDEAAAPVFVGGFAFAPGMPSPHWRELGEATFTLPRWRYLPGRLTFCGPANDWTALGELEGLQRHLSARYAPRTSSKALRVRQLTERRWGEGVAAALREIQRGAFEKLVLARAAHVEHAGPIDIEAVLAVLAEWKWEATRFVFAGRRSTFLGLTPERLVELRHGRVRVDALAGSAAPGEGAHQLLGSPKDRLEHRLVVDEILQRLGPRCQRLWASSRPQLRPLPSVVHLLTSIRGQARAGTHVLDLVEALHPTPAVAGKPADRASRWIAKHEAEPRGWYAGAVGWFDRHGDGDFAVAIRSALIRGKQAWVYAGSGIVPGSDAAGEYAETALKLRPMLAALGASS
jgi:isochorismate synthase